MHPADYTNDRWTRAGRVTDNVNNIEETVTRTLPAGAGLLVVVEES